jgi:preprotein translocase subunit SecG
MQSVLLVIHLMVVTALVIVVLLQRSDGGALGIGGGGGFMTGRGQANALTRATAMLATVFFITSILLTILASVDRRPRSILDQGAPASQTTPGAPAAPQGGNLLDQLNRIQGGPPQPATSTAPGTGAPSAPVSPPFTPPAAPMAPAPAPAPAQQ